MLASNWRRAVVYAALLVLFGSSHSLIGQSFGQDAQKASGEISSTHFQQLLKTGEFTVALQHAHSAANELDRDAMLVQIANAQRSGDTGTSAFSTLAMVQDDTMRFGGYDRLTGYGRNGDDVAAGRGQAGGQSGFAGGISEQDFDELMDLLQETIDPDSWEENGGNGRLRPFPSGVWVDSKGTLKSIKEDKSGRLSEVRNISGNSNQQASVELRKISLARLEQELQRRSAVGEPVTDDLKYMAGIYRLKYVILYPDTNDVVIAGPAGPWHFDRQGRAINSKNGHPVLNLDALVVCLRNARDGGQFQCSIDPRESNLEDAKQFISTTTLKGKRFRTELQKTLGEMDVTVAGIDPTSHAARVIVEADYRMKLIGLGVQPTVSGLKNYFERIHLDTDGNLPEMDQLVRWWFTMNYDSVLTNPERNVFEINGQGVRLLSESEFWDANGQRQHTGTSSAPASGFAEDFTRRFPEIAMSDPVFGQLRNVFDCALAANVIHREGLNRKINWNLSFLDGSQRPGLLSYHPDSEMTPTQVGSILGQRVITHRDNGKTRRHTISGFGGGVVFDASQHANKNNIKVSEQSELGTRRDDSRPVNNDRVDWKWD